MASETTNYQLVKPDPEEFYDVRVPNENMDKIDVALKALSEALGGIDLATLSQAISKVDGRVTQHLAEKASGSKWGHVKIGKNINVTVDGVISIPDATQSTMGVMRAGDGLTVSNGVVSAYMQTVTDKLVANTPANYPLGKSVMFITPNATGSEDWRNALGIVGGSYYLIVETTKTTTSNGIQRVTAYLLTASGTPRIFVRNANNSGYGPFTEITAKASTSQPGVVQLEDSTGSVATDKAATANAVRMVNEKGVTAYNLAGEVQSELRAFRSALTEGFTANQFSDGLTTLDAFNVTAGYYNQSLSRLEM